MKYLLSIIILTMAIESFCWSSGHDDINHQALELLPKKLKKLMSKDDQTNFVAWSHKADDFTPWDKLDYIKIPASDKKLLLSHGLKNPYAFHNSTGQAVNFILLTQAFKDKDSKRIAFWASCLLHVLADEAACNHGPLIHYMTCAFLGDYKMQMGKGVGVDYGVVSKSGKGKTIAKKILRKIKPEIIPGKPEDILVKVMMSSLESNDYMTRRGKAIAASYAKKAPRKTHDLALKALAELGTYGIKHGVDLINTAWKLSEKKRLPELTEKVISRYKKERAEFIKNRPLENDSLFAEFIMKNPKGIGVLVEPSISMSECSLSFGGKYLSAAIMETLKKNEFDCFALDIRSLEKNIPKPKQMPVLILCAGKFKLSTKSKKNLEGYAKRGKLIIIGGTNSNLPGAVASNLISLPVAQVNSRNFAKGAKIEFSNSFQDAMGSEKHPFARNPITKIGWQKPICSLSLKKSKKIRPLASMTKSDGKKLIVAGAIAKSKSKVTSVFLTEYLMSPYIFTKENTIDDPSKPQLDSFGKKLLLESLKMLNPKANGKKGS